MNNFFQRLLWNIAGAEIPILEKCRTDYKKFAAIGATILMTAIIALCAGTSAAWYFTQKGTDDTGELGWSLAFGVLWAALIFCIDRSLVITLKKDPTKIYQKFVMPLLSRAALAIVVAFMVSIPLELVIFEDYIQANEENFKADQIAVLGAQLRSNSDENVLTDRISNADLTLKRLGKESERLGKDANEYESKINKLEAEKKSPNSPEYRNAKNQYEAARKNYNEASANYNTENRKQYPSNSLLDTYQNRMKNANSTMSSAKRNMNTAAQVWRNDKQTEIDKLIPLRDAKIAEKTRSDQIYGTTLTSQLNDKDRAQKVAEEREIKEASKQEKLDRGNHFIRNFQILEYAVWQTDKNGHLTESTQLMFLWLIRILFFIIEILPTVVKIVSPIGSYERMIYAEEKELMEYINSDEYSNKIKNIHRLAISSQEELEQQQHDTELELKKNILNKIKNAQLEVAELAIEKWKDTEKRKITMTAATPSMTTGVKSDTDDDEMTTFV